MNTGSPQLLALALALTLASAHCGGAVEGDGAASSWPDASVPSADAACSSGSSDCAAGDASVEDASAGSEDSTVAEAGNEASDAADGSTDAGDAASEDAAPVCAPMTTGPCDPVAQCGCPPGYACGFAPMGTSTYCRLVGTTGPYEHCQYDNDCAAGLRCDLDTCMSYCLTDSDCVGIDPYRKCWHGASVFTMQPYGLCNRQCNPLDPQSNLGGYGACGAGFHCSPSKIGDTICDSWNAKPPLAYGDACTTTSQCPTDSTCMVVPGDASDAGTADAGSTMRCLRWCHPGDPCPGGGTCIDIGYYAAGTPVGLCPP